MTTITIYYKISLTYSIWRHTYIQIATSLQQKAYEYLKSYILNDRYEYGVIYSETKVSKELGISRTPMRDAIHRLAQERYIDIIPSKGFCLHQLTITDVIETFQVRSAIEGYCVVQIAKEYNSSKARNLFRKLEELLEIQKQIMTTDRDIKSFVEYDNQFHIDTVSYVDNSAFNELFGSYIYQIKRLAILSLNHEGRMEDTFQEHTDILNAMKQGDVQNIYAITMQHMDKPKGINLEDLENM